MKILNTKLVKRLIAVICIGFILGIALYFITNDSEKSSINNTLENYILLVKSENFNYGQSFLITLVNNLKSLSAIWISGILFILILIPPIILFIKSYLLGFGIINIIATFKLKGILYALIISVPNIINLFLLILMSFYSIKFAVKTYKIIKNDKSINLKKYIKNYIIIYLIITSLILINSLIETYLISNILKLVS